MKKTISLFLALLLILPIYRASSDTNIPDYLKIGLFYASTAKDSIKLTSGKGFIIGKGEAEGFIKLYEMIETQLTITIGENNTYILNNLPLASEGEISIKTIDGANIKVEGSEYRGFVLLKQKDGKMTVINVVGLEEYLYSVIGKEMSPSWNIEALKAQAVCARTYALTHLGTYKEYGFNLCTTQRTQVYPGVSSESAETILAVQTTSGKTVKYNGKTVEVFYFSSSGGVTEASENVWSSALPYLRSVKDPYENPAEATKYNWTVNITKDKLKEDLLKKGVDIGDIVSIEITQRADSGRVTELKIIGTTGEKVAKKEGTRTLLGLNSQQFSIVGGEAPVDINGNKQMGSAVYTADGIKTLGNIVNVLGAGGVKEYKTTVSGDSFKIEGKGWGHAVGMSQWGAKAMADKGFLYTDILKFYFTGVEIG